ncbi:MAG: hypothetical protein ACKOBF_13730, partial [Limnohabitans sp.]
QVVEFHRLASVLESLNTGQLECTVTTATEARGRELDYPRPVVTRLHAEVQKALQTPEVRERMTAVGGEVIPGSIDMFAALIKSERVRYEKLVREANIKPD